ncbi:DUF2158 domain-containing protein [Comamonas koreensis]|uniref:DUF2158 domain-containing protein n=1 Tax=Comamonas koreensis TaxID=160825 RepID=UPI0015F90394|nr:DUF2158 domain-containing protein [Comamonas koreensis]
MTAPSNDLSFLNCRPFSASSLIKLPRPPMLAKVWPGNRVQLASGGPEMTVMDVAADQVTCWWDAGDGTTGKHTFDIALLTCYGAR